MTEQTFYKKIKDLIEVGNTDDTGKDGQNKMINLSQDQLDEESIGKAKKLLDRTAIEHMIPQQQALQRVLELNFALDKLVYEHQQNQIVILAKQKERESKNPIDEFDFETDML